LTKDRIREKSIHKNCTRKKKTKRCNKSSWTKYVLHKKQRIMMI